MPLPVEYSCVAGDTDQVNQLAGGDATHGVKVLEQGEVARLQVVDVLSRSDECLLDIAAG